MYYVDDPYALQIQKGVNQEEKHLSQFISVFLLDGNSQLICSANP